MSNNNNERRELTAAELDLVTGGAGYVGAHCVRELNRIGHDAENRMRAIFMESPLPRTRIATGSRASAGIGRMKSISDLDDSYAMFDDPSSRPMGTETSTATPRPMPETTSVDPTAARNAESESNWNMLTNDCENGGRYLGEISPSRLMTSASANTIAKPATPRTKRPVEDIGTAARKMRGRLSEERLCRRM